MIASSQCTVKIKLKHARPGSWQSGNGLVTALPGPEATVGARREHRVVDIAAQAGLSRATVDRVLHGREGVRPETVAQVNLAIDELQRQREQVHLSGRTIILDLVMHTPERRAVASRDALEAELRSLRPAVLRARSHLNEHSDPAAAAAVLDALGRKGSHGVILKAPTTRWSSTRCCGWPIGPSRR